MSTSTTAVADNRNEKDPLLGGASEGGDSRNTRTSRTFDYSGNAFPLGGSYETHVLGGDKSGDDMPGEERPKSNHHHTRTDTQLTWGSAAASNVAKHVRERIVPHINRKRKLIKNNASFALLLVVLAYTPVVFFVPLALHFRPRSAWCPLPTAGEADKYNYRPFFLDDGESPYENPDYVLDPCRYVRLACLLGLTLEDCDISRRMVVSVLLGSAVGYERRSADRPAGVRTMALVSLGACFFTISSIMAFKSSTMGWDASRVTAALPSGVGFLGGALIWKGSIFVDELHEEKHQVHGLTTAASLWLSAALGVGAGGALYAVTIYATALVLFMLRYGPKLYEQEEDDNDEEAEHQEIEELEKLFNSINKKDWRQLESTNDDGLPLDESVRNLSERYFAEKVALSLPAPGLIDNLAQPRDDEMLLTQSLADAGAAEEVEENLRHFDPRLVSVTEDHKFYSGQELGIPHRKLRFRSKRVPTFGS